LRPLQVNITPSFNHSIPAVGIAASGQSRLSLTTTLGPLQVGNSTTGVAWLVQTLNNTAEIDAGETSVVYSTQLDNYTSLSMTYTFNQNRVVKTFAGTNLTVNPQSLKWSVDLSSSPKPSINTTTLQSAADSITLTYDLSDLSPSASTNQSTDQLSVQQHNNTPSANITTYYLSVGSASQQEQQSKATTVAQVQVFDVAEVDGELVSIQHQVNITKAGYVLILVLPPFNATLFYDPVLGLGLLVEPNSNPGGSQGSGSSLVVAVAVAIPVAAVGVLVVATAGSTLIVVKKKRANTKLRRTILHSL